MLWNQADQGCWPVEDRGKPVQAWCSPGAWGPWQVAAEPPAVTRLSTGLLLSFSIPYVTALRTDVKTSRTAPIDLPVLYTAPSPLLSCGLLWLFLINWFPGQNFPGKHELSLLCISFSSLLKKHIMPNISKGANCCTLLRLHFTPVRNGFHQGLGCFAGHCEMESGA